MEKRPVGRPRGVGPSVHWRKREQYRKKRIPKTPFNCFRLVSNKEYVKNYSVIVYYYELITSKMNPVTDREEWNYLHVEDGLNQILVKY